MLPAYSRLNPAHSSNGPRVHIIRNIIRTHFSQFNLLNWANRQRTTPKIMVFDNGQALIDLGIVCLSTNLFNVFRTLLPGDIHPGYRTFPTVFAVLLLSLLWVGGLLTWRENFSRASDETCNKSMIGGLIAANFGLLCISSCCPCMCHESRVSYVAWPTYLGMLAGYW